MSINIFKYPWFCYLICASQIPKGGLNCDYDAQIIPSGVKFNYFFKVLILCNNLVCSSIT
jgi:hypothetical protein